MLFNLKILKFHILNILIFTYLLSYILGPAVINIYITLLSIAGFIFVLKNYKFLHLLKNDQSIIVLIIFFLYLLLKEFFYNHQNYELIVFFRIVVIFIFISLYLKINKNIYEININLLFILLILICLDTFFQFIFGYNFLGFEKFQSDRLTSFFKDEPIVGSFLMKIFFPCFVYYYYLNKNTFLVICTLFSFFAVFISGERMPFLQLLFGLTLFLLLFSKNKIRNSISLLFLIIFSIFLSFNFSELKNRYVSTFNGFEILIDDIIDHKAISKDYDNNGIKDYYFNFASGIELWKLNKLFGNGYRFYNNNCSEVLKNQHYFSGCSTHPHNIYIELLSDHGLIGLIIFLVFIFYLFKNFLTNHKNKKYYGFLIASIVITVPFVTSQSIFSSFYGSIFFLNLFIIKIYDTKNLY